MYDTITFVQNDCFAAEGFVVCGTRGWLTPDNEDYKEADEKIYKRELMRMQSSLDSGKRYVEALRTETVKDGNGLQDADPELIAVMHFPPVSKAASFSGFQQMFEDYGIKHVLYGHIHGEDGFKNTIIGEYHGVTYDLISCDFLNCVPMRIERSR